MQVTFLPTPPGQREVKQDQSANQNAELTFVCTCEGQRKRCTTQKNWFGMSSGMSWHAYDFGAIEELKAWNCVRDVN